MKKVKLQKVRREILEALVSYLRDADVFILCPGGEDDEAILMNRTIGTLMKPFRLGLFNKLQSREDQKQFDLTLEPYTATAFMLYYKYVSIEKLKELEKVWVQSIAGKIHKAIS